MALALCVQCGASKKRAADVCRRCGFDPTQDEGTLVKSVYLSVERFDDDPGRDYRVELDEIAKRMKAGEPPAFDAEELNLLLRQKRLVDGVPPSAVWAAVARLFLPGVALLIVLAAILLGLKFLR